VSNTRDLMERVEDIVNDLLLVSDMFDKGVSAMDAIVDTIDDMKISDSDEREIARFIIEFALKLISDVMSKLDEIEKDLEDIERELETTG